MDIHETNTHKNTKIVRVLRTLGDENRFQIIRMLLENDLCVGALSRILNISKPAISQHLKILRETGLVRGEKLGYWTHYRVEKELLRESAQGLSELIDPRSNATGNSAFICLRKKEDETGTGKGSETYKERKVLQMCKNCCEQPDKLKTKPEECTPEQIKECHGEAEEHSCESKKEK